MEVHDSQRKIIGSLVFESSNARIKATELEIPISIPLASIYADSEEDMRIGRDPSKCRFSIEDMVVSKQHFRIYSITYDNKDDEPNTKSLLPPFIYCEDLESRNGTYVNDVLIGIMGRERTGYLLSDGDVIEIRPYYRFRFHQPVTQETNGRNSNQSIDLQYLRDRYVVSDRILGSGNTGVVYLAKEISTMKQVACKIIDIGKAVESFQNSHLSSLAAGVPETQIWEARVQRAAKYKKKVMREVQILSQLNHPNIINLKKAFYSKKTIYMFMELAAGGDLFSYLELYGGLLEDHHSRVITRQIALAIEFIHSKGIAHRDIKPENILVAHKDIGHRVILTDFGLATTINMKTGRMLSKVGTANYIAPEIEVVDRSGNGYTTAADMWSLGIVTMLSLTGDIFIPRSQLSAQNQEGISAGLLGVNNDELQRQWSQISASARNFLRRLLIPDADQRMTATEAVNHSWYTKPRGHPGVPEELYKRSIRFWVPRGEHHEVVEYLPGWNSQTAPHQNPQLPRKKIPDSTSSPYFGLDRHLNPKIPSKRKRMLADLNDSGCHFLGSNIFEKYSPMSEPTPKASLVLRVKSVDGKNTFDPPFRTKVIVEGVGDLDEVSLNPETHTPKTEDSFAIYVSDDITALESTAGQTSYLTSEAADDIAFPANKRQNRLRDTENKKEP